MSSNSLFSLIVVFSLLFFCVVSSPVVFHSKVNQETINQICDKATPFASDCRNSLNSNPKTAGANIKQLCQIAIDLVVADVFYMFAVLNNAFKRTSDPKERELYQGCLNDYNDILRATTEADKNLNQKGDYVAITNNAGTMFVKSYACENRFETPSLEIAIRTNNTLGSASVVFSVAVYALGS